MSAKAQAKTQIKTPTAPTAARIAQPPITAPEYQAERPDIAAQLESAARLGHSLEEVSVSGAAPAQIQARSLIQRQSVPEDEDEEEELQLQRKPAALQRQELPEEDEEEGELQMKREPAAIQRQENPEEDEDEEELQLQREPASLQRQEDKEDEEEDRLQMQPDTPLVGNEGGPVPSAVETAINHARGGGQPLDGATQAQMGEMLGHDFSGVRVHTDAQADALNQQLNARAFTTGQDIFFRRGEYNPGSGSGRELVAHELTHVVQQGTGKVPRSGKGMTVRPAGDVFEHQSDAQAKTTSPFSPVARKSTDSEHPAKVGSHPIQRAVVTAMANDDWLAEMNTKLARTIANDPVVQWGKTAVNSYTKSEKVVVMGHGGPGVLYNTSNTRDFEEITAIPTIKGSDIANELVEGSVKTGTEIILWSCHAGEEEEGGNPSLVEATRNELNTRGIKSKVSGAIGVHIPNVPVEKRFVGPEPVDEEGQKLFNKLESHYKRRYYLAPKEYEEYKIEAKKRREGLDKKGDRTIYPSTGNPFSTWQEVIQEIKNRRKFFATKKAAMSNINSFYKKLFSDRDFKTLIKPIGSEGGQKVMWPKID